MKQSKDIEEQVNISRDLTTCSSIAQTPTRRLQMRKVESNSKKPDKGWIKFIPEQNKNNPDLIAEYKKVGKKVLIRFRGHTNE